MQIPTGVRMPGGDEAGHRTVLDGTCMAFQPSWFSREAMDDRNVQDALQFAHLPTHEATKRLSPLVVEIVDLVRCVGDHSLAALASLRFLQLLPAILDGDQDHLEDDEDLVFVPSKERKLDKQHC